MGFLDKYLSITGYTKEQLEEMRAKQKELKGVEKERYMVLTNGVSRVLYGYDYQERAYEYTKGTSNQTPPMDADKEKFSMFLALKKADKESMGQEFTQKDIENLRLVYNSVNPDKRSQFVMNTATEMAVRDDGGKGLNLVKDVALGVDYKRVVADTKLAKKTVGYEHALRRERHRKSPDYAKTPSPKEMKPPRHAIVGRAVGNVARDVFYADYTARDLLAIANIELKSQFKARMHDPLRATNQMGNLAKKTFNATKAVTGTVKDKKPKAPKVKTKAKDDGLSL